jgi:hypothetical protein
MPKPIKFEFQQEILEFDMHKVDRARLYGFKETEVIDENGNACELMTLSDDGKKLIGKGGTGIGYLTADGNWADKANLRPVGLDGEEIEPVPSSFAAPVLLESECSIDEYLEHNIRLVYRLDHGAIPESFFSQLKRGTIFKFPYSYRGGLVADVGFLLMNENNHIFFLVGERGTIEFKSLQQTAAVANADGDAIDGDLEGDLMDFGMI